MQWQGLGCDTWCMQVAGLPEADLNDLAAVLRPGEVADNHGRGYFKLMRARRRDTEATAAPATQSRLLVVRCLFSRYQVHMMMCAGKNQSCTEIA